MKQHTLDAAGCARLTAHIGTTVRQLVWDINAVYLVGDEATTKAEVLVVAPASPEPSGWDEVFPIRVDLADAHIGRFEPEGEAGYGYQVVAQDVLITGIELVRLGVRFPEDEECRASACAADEPGLNIVDCGLLVHTALGVLVAYSQHPCFGFYWGASQTVALLPPAAARALVPHPYELVAVDAGAA